MDSRPLTEMLYSFHESILSGAQNCKIISRNQSSGSGFCTGIPPWTDRHTRLKTLPQPLHWRMVMTFVYLLSRLNKSKVVSNMFPSRHCHSDGGSEIMQKL